MECLFRASRCRCVRRRSAVCAPGPKPRHIPPTELIFAAAAPSLRHCLRSSKNTVRAPAYRCLYQQICTSFFLAPARGSGASAQCHFGVVPWFTSGRYSLQSTRQVCRWPTSLVCKRILIQIMKRNWKSPAETMSDEGEEFTASRPTTHTHTCDISLKTSIRTQVDRL